MRAKTITNAPILFLLGLMILGLAACGTDDGVAAGQADEAHDDAQSMVAVEDTHDDDDGHAEGAVDEHDDGDDHAVAVEDGHDDDAAEAGGHSHGAAGAVDPDAPVTHITASEFAYGTSILEVEAGEAFTIEISNVGLLEHDITFEGLEDEGGLHVQPGEEGIGSWSIHEAGEYVYYCTVLGHREAGMTGTLTVLAAHVDDHDNADGHHDEEAEVMHDDVDGHHDDDAEEAMHDEADDHHDDDAVSGA